MKAGHTFNDYAHTPAEPPNHGKRWTDEAVKELSLLFLRGASTARMCEMMGRTRDSILAKLVSCDLLEQQPYGAQAYVYRITKKAEELSLALFSIEASKPSTETETTKEPIMSTLSTIENRTLINGSNGADMSDEELFVVIAKLEERKRKFEAIVTKPKKLVEAIAKLDVEIAAVADYVDAR